jgi:hypothetical protein
MATPSTARVHRFRQRQEIGRVVLSIEVDETALIEALIKNGMLEPTQVDDKDAIAEAAAKVLKIFYEE